MPSINNTYHEVLTEYVQQLYLNPDEEVDIRREIFPDVSVDEATGQYDKYGKDAALTAVDTKLTPEGSAHRLKQLKTIDTYLLEDHALEISTWKIRDPEKSSERHRRAGANTLMSAQFASSQKQAVDKLKAAVSVTSSLGAWVSGTASPIDDIETLLRLVRMGSGRRATKLIMGNKAWSIIRNHPAVISRVGGITAQVSEEQFVSLFTVRNLKLVIADTTIEVNGTLTELLADDVIALHVEDAPTTEDLSFGKNFTTYPNGPEVTAWTQNGIIGVDTLMWTSDYHVTNPNACARLVIS